jgi:hypothetical protein
MGNGKHKGTPAANAAGRKKGNAPCSQRGRRVSEEGSPWRIVWGGGNDHDRDATGIGASYKVSASLGGEPRMASRMPVC